MLNRFILAFVFCVVHASQAFGAEKLVFMREDRAGKQIYQADTGGAPQIIQPLTRGTNWHLYPSISADGAQVAWVEGTDQKSLELRLINLVTGRLEQWATPLTGALHPEFSGDAKHLAFTAPAGVDGKMQIVLIALEEARRNENPEVVQTPEGELHRYAGSFRVLQSDEDSFFPSLASDGSFVVFQRSKKDGTKDIVELDLFTNKTKSITEPGSKAMSPELSFDDRYVVFTELQQGNWDIYAYDRLTGEKHRATTDAAQDFAPTLNSAGDLIYASDSSGHFVLTKVPRFLSAPGKPQAPEVLYDDLEADLYAPAASGDLSYSQSLLASVPSPARSSFGSIEYRGKIYVAGGHQGQEHTYPPQSFLDQFEAYDLNTGRWQELARRSVPAQGFELAAYGEYIYAFGGFAYSPNHKPGWQSLDLIERYSILEDKWEVIGKMPRKRSSHVVAQVGDLVYLIGGWDSTPKKPGDFEGTFHREIDVFDLKTETMGISPHQLPDPLRRAFTAVTSHGQILLLGGLGVGSTHFELLDQVTSFDPILGTWSELPRLPFATFAPAAGILDNRLYAFGGMFKLSPMDYTYVNHIFSLDLRSLSKPWAHAGRYLHESKGFARVVRLGPSELGIIGGHSYENATIDAPVATFESLKIR